MAGYQEPAFPMPGSTDPNGNVTYPQFGMTLRDYFAGQAVHDLIGKADDMTGPREIARVAYEIADAMIAERSK